MKRLFIEFNLLCLFGVSAAAAAQTDTYQINSLDEQYVVYSHDPGIAQEATIAAEKIREHFFKTLRWMSFSQYPTQIWIVKEPPEKNFPPAVSSLEWLEGGWVRKIKTYPQPELFEEILPRELIQVLLLELGMDQRAQNKRPESPLPFWLIEGFRKRIEEGNSAGSLSVPLISLKELLETESLPQTKMDRERFAASSAQFVELLLDLPEGAKKMKKFIRLYAATGKPVSFHKIYKKDFKTEKDLQAAWEDKRKRAVAGKKEALSPKNRRASIMQYLDALEAQ